MKAFQLYFSILYLAAFHSRIAVASDSTTTKGTESSNTPNKHMRGSISQQYCGGASVGNGVCWDGTCCSENGWCGTTPAHCSNSTPQSSVLSVDAPTPVSAAEMCGGGQVGNGVCADGTCCSPSGWCGTSDEHCYESARMTTKHHRSLATCGNGNVGDKVCANGMCCSQYGYCGTGTAYCGSGTTGTCGGGSVGNGICSNGMCCSPYGWCGTTADYCGGASTPTGTGAPGALLTLADLQAALNMYNSLQGTSAQATQTVLDLINDATRNFSLYRRIAFVAQTIWESGGYVYTEEQNLSARGNYQTCDWNTGAQATNGKLFYGRGYIQLSWCANYKAYGRARMINGDPDYFYKYPELVATTYKMDSAKWFFEARVTDDSGKFGLTTKAINGAIECQTSQNYADSVPKKRYRIFKALADKMGLTGYSEVGCYN